MSRSSVAGPRARPITLAKFGYPVLLADRAVFPRDKLCGDFINPVNWPILQELEVSQVVLLREHAEVRKFCLTASNGTEAATALPVHGAQKFGLGLRRYYLDQLLMERVKRDGACVVEGARVKRLCKNDAGWVLQFERFSAKRRHLLDSMVQSVCALDSGADR